jgi:hypothetical protein
LSVYSLKNYKATFSGPGVSPFAIGDGAGVAKEGIAFSMIEDKNTITTGGTGDIMHSLNASDSGNVTLRFLKISPVNALLNAAYNFQKTNPGSWGQNTIRGADTQRGDVQTCVELAFKKQPDLTYAVEGGTVEWVFEGRIFEKLGNGAPAIQAAA